MDAVTRRVLMMLLVMMMRRYCTPADPKCDYEMLRELDEMMRTLTSDRGA
jgi:endonuclease III